MSSRLSEPRERFPAWAAALRCACAQAGRSSRCSVRSCKGSRSTRFVAMDAQTSPVPGQAVRLVRPLARQRMIGAEPAVRVRAALTCDHTQLSAVPVRLGDCRRQTPSAKKCWPRQVWHASVPQATQPRLLLRPT